MRTTLGGLAIALLLVAWAGSAKAQPEPSPLRLTVSPARLTVGERAVVHVDLAPGARVSRPALPVDLYLAWFFGPMSSPFLTPRGTWSVEPVPFRQGVALGDFSPIVAEWPKVGPAGRISLGLVIVESSANPWDRSNWIFQPALVWLRVSDAVPVTDIDDVSVMMLAALALLTVTAGVVIFRAGPD